MKTFNKINRASAGGILFLLVFFSFGCSSKACINDSVNDFTNSDTLRLAKTYWFSSVEDGKKIRWKARVKGDEIISLYKDDVYLNKDEINKYRNLVMDYVGDMKKKLFDYDNFVFDIPQFTFDFNDKEFRDNMEKMSEQLKNMKYDFNFDNEEFRESMKDMKKRLKKFDRDNYFNSKEFEESMEKLHRNLSNHPLDIKVNLDFDKLNSSMDKVRIKMKDMKIDLGHLKERLAILQSFLKEMKSELISDGYLDQNDDDFEIEFSKDELIINGTKLPNNLLEKYKKLYREYFDKEIGDHMRIIN